MSLDKNIDYIIVGQGLAGSAIALQLLKLGKKILVIDEPRKNRASLVAAGLFNPITGKKMTKTWMADTIFPYLHKFYPDAERMTGRSFFYPKPLYRPFVSVEEQNEWMGRSSDELYREYVRKVMLKKTVSGVNDPFGGILLQQCGYVDTGSLIDGVRELIRREGVFLAEHFEEARLRILRDAIGYGEWTAGKIIFCQGVLSGNLFGWLPVKPLKGETLTIEAVFNDEYIVNRGVYIVPTSEANRYKVGATYDYNYSSEGITEKGREELEGRCGEILVDTFEVVTQDWGLRPTVPDRRPLLGRHPEYLNVALFNGLGTKGVSLAPYFSGNLIGSLENHEALNNAADLNRYKSVY